MSSSQVPSSNSNSSLAFSPPLIIILVILAAGAVVVVCASVTRFCSSAPPHSSSDDIDTGGNNAWSVNNAPGKEQLARMKEVRWINNMYAWERGRLARMEIGELRPSTVFLRASAKARMKEDRDWDQWSGVNDDRNSVFNHDRSSTHYESCSAAGHSKTYDETSSAGPSRLPIPFSWSRNEFRNSLQVSDNGNSNRASSILLPPGLSRDLSRSDFDSETSTSSPGKHYGSDIPAAFEEIELTYGGEMANSKARTNYDGQHSLQPLQHQRISQLRERGTMRAQPFYEEDSGTAYLVPVSRGHRHAFTDQSAFHSDPEQSRNAANVSPPKITLNDSSEDIADNVTSAAHRMNPPRHSSVSASRYDHLIRFDGIPLEDVTRVHNRDSLSSRTLVNYTSGPSTESNLERDGQSGESATTFDALDARGILGSAHSMQRAGGGNDDRYDYAAETVREREEHGTDRAGSNEEDAVDRGRPRANSEGVKGMIAQWEGRHGRFHR